MNILFIGDGVTPTGFSTVNHNIIKFLPENWNIHHLAINYHGDPHEYKHKIYPASIGGDIWGFNRLPAFGANKFDAVFILNDIWIVDRYLEIIKNTWKKIPPIIVYFPVDAEEFDKKWFKHFDIVSIANVYTKFGKEVCQKVAPNIDFRIVTHGINNKDFFKLDKTAARTKLFGEHKELMDGFVFLNAGRNQPRKRLDIALEAFKLFAENKSDVYYYHHAGLVDAGWNIPQLVERYGIGNKFITTNKEEGIQREPVEVVNLIYNACDVGLNTGLGEGFGLPNVEHASVGAPQIVPAHSACQELFNDVGLLVPTTLNFTYENTLTVGKVVSPVDVAAQMDFIYSNRELYDFLSVQSINKFTRPEYSWEFISNIFKEQFEELW